MIIQSPSRVIYARTGRGMQDSWYPRKWLDKSQLKNAVALDLCCGYGDFVSQMRGTWWPLGRWFREKITSQPTIEVNITGVDFKRPLLYFVSRNWDRKPQHFVEANVTRLPFADNSQDLVYSSFGVFYYANDDEQVALAALNEVARVLKPGGKLRVAPVVKKFFHLLEEVPALQITEKKSHWFKPRNYYCEAVKSSGVNTIL